MTDKTVYILGAGFSKEAGSPSQEDLVNKIFEIAELHSCEFGTNTISTFKKFLTETLQIPEDLHRKIPLEDIFTPLDKCIIDNVSFRNLDIKETLKIRELIDYLIGKTMEVILRYSSTKSYIDEFAEFIAKKASVRQDYNFSKSDPVSIISTNWDILLDNSIKNEIDSNYHNKAVVDYCCHISSYRSGDNSVKPGLEILGRGGFNIKLLKLHGSLNWLQCPRCLRVYVDFYNKIAISQYIDPVNCRHCDKNFGKEASHKLISNLIMPTFLKNLSNPQYKLIWQNAGIELSEATRIVFIGYSLPNADFEMRQLLSRMIRTNVNIEVVDYGEITDARIKATINRYNVFFGNRKPKYYLNGAKEYIENHLSQ